MGYRDEAVRRRKDRERFRKRTAERVAQGLCPRCGDGPPEPERSCANPAMTSATKPAARATPGCGRRANREGIRPRLASTNASGPAATGRSGARRASAPAAARCRPPRPRVLRAPAWKAAAPTTAPRYARGKAAGLPYGGANADAKRKSGRTKSRRRQKARREAGLCIRCGQHPPRRGRHDLHAVPRPAPGGGTAAICRTPRGGALHALRRAGLRRPGALRSLRRHRRGRPVARTQERPEPQALYRTEGAGAVHRLRSAVAGGQPLRALRREVLPRLGVFQGHSGLGSELDGDRAGDRPGARPSTARPTWRSASPSRSSHATGSKCCAIPRL